MTDKPQPPDPAKVLDAIKALDEFYVKFNKHKSELIKSQQQQQQQTDNVR